MVREPALAGRRGVTIRDMPLTCFSSPIRNRPRSRTCEAMSPTAPLPARRFSCRQVCGVEGSERLSSVYWVRKWMMSPSSPAWIISRAKRTAGTKR